MKVILTSAIIDSFFEERKEEYKKSFEFIKERKSKEDIFFVETILKEGAFLEEYGVKVFYSKTNNPSLKNKGVKEIKALKEFFNNFEIDDNEIIVKLTGRYRFTSDKFLKEIENEEYDIYYTTSHGQAFFGGFAIRKKYFSEFINSLDLVEMESKMINVELEFIKFINKRDDIKSKQIDKIDIYSKINNKVVVNW